MKIHSRAGGQDRERLQGAHEALKIKSEAIRSFVESQPLVMR